MQTELTSDEAYSVAACCFINFCMYTDRFCVIAMADHLCKNYKVGFHWYEKLQLGFLVPYMLASPIFGYLGDRNSRRKIMLTCSLLCSISILVSAIAPNMYFFLFMRICVGACQAGFCVVAPSVLADIARDEELTKVLGYFYIMAPVGCGVGFLLSGVYEGKPGHWWWCVLGVALLTFIGSIFFFFGLDPKRGYKDSLQIGKGKRLKATSYDEDLQSLWHNKSFRCVSFALASLYLVSGVITLNGPELLVLGYELIQINPENSGIAPDMDVKFGATILLTGIVGVPLGSKCSRLCRHILPRVDTIICGFGILISLPIIIISVLTTSLRAWETFFYIFFGGLAFNLTWAASHDILLYIVIPQRRCSVIGWHMVISHFFGDIIGPSVVEQLRAIFYSLDFRDALELYDDPDVDIKRFFSLRDTVLTIMIFQFLSGILFIWNALYILEYIEKAKKETWDIVYKHKIPYINTETVNNNNN